MSKPIKRTMRRAFPRPPSWYSAGINRCGACSVVTEVFFFTWSRGGKRGRWRCPDRHEGSIRIPLLRESPRYLLRCVIRKHLSYRTSCGPSSTYRYHASITR